MSGKENKKDGQEKIPTLSIVSAIPLVRGAPPDTLTYFSRVPVPLGSFIEVPLRGKKVPAIALSVEDASKERSGLRALPYELQKVARVHGKNFLTPAFIESVTEAARYFAGSLGATFAALTPREIIQNPRALGTNETRATENGMHIQYVLQADDEDRVAQYRGLIREEFAHQKSVFLILPTVEDAERMYLKAAKGIEEHTVLLHGSLAKKKLLAEWKRGLEHPHPVLVVATGAFLSLPRHDLGAIIIERENSRAYKTLARPFVDIRTFAEILAKKLRVRLTVGDMVLRAETMWRVGEGEFFPATPIQSRLTNSATLTIADMRRYKTSPSRGFTFLSDELETLLRKTKTENEHLFLFVPRRGFALEVVCADCGNAVTCNRCSAPMALHEEERVRSAPVSAGRFFRCHKCGQKRDANERCRTCTSWKLQMLGAGTARAEEEIKKRIPDMKILKVDSDTTPTADESRKTVEQFYGAAGSVLIGTEKALLFMDKKTENAAVFSVESFFSLPDFRVGERLLYLLLSIRARTTKTMVLQTRNPDDRIIRAAAEGTLGEFFKNELVERQFFRYPPTTVLIKLSVSGKKDAVEQTIASLAEEFKVYEATPFRAFTEFVKGRFSMHLLIRVPREQWVDDTLLQKLRALPPSIRVAVDPDTLL